MDPVASIVEQVRGDIWLPPPQLYELSRMANFVECDHLQRFAAQRQRRGVERWLPIIRPTSSGRLSIYPGTNVVILTKHNRYLNIVDIYSIIYIHICMYVSRERERERERDHIIIELLSRMSTFPFNVIKLLLKFPLVSLTPFRN